MLPAGFDNTLEKKAYQLLIGRLDGGHIGDAAYEEKIRGLVKKGMGGFILFGGEKESAGNFLSDLQSIADIPLFIASDVERGVGQQISGTTLFPCQMAVAAALGRRSAEERLIIEQTVRAVAEESKDVGINIPLIPVLDVNQNADNPIISTRAFSDDAETVAELGSHYIRVLEGEGLISCAKHFPGHGDTASDSHITLPVINKPRDALMDVDIMPFRRAVEAGVSSIMVGHLSVTAFNGEPASLSREIVTHLLKEELDFRGLIMTDALNMNALQGYANVPARCINAGVDILLHPVDPEVSAAEIMDAVRMEDIKNGQIEAAVDRIIRQKERIARVSGPEVDYSAHDALATRISEMAITLVKDTSGLLPFAGKKVSVVFCGDTTLFSSSPLRKVFEGRVVSADEDRTSGITVFAVFTSVSAWKGSSGIDQEEKLRIQKHIKKSVHSIVISFGSPYVLRHFHDADILIAAYEATEQAQKAVIKCLRGEIEFNGRLPVKLDG
ncbi:MAG: glycoside hydrolase family 3 protein [Nitrospirota bacterium]